MSKIKNPSIIMGGLEKVLGTSPIPATSAEDRVSRLDSTIEDPILRQQLREQRERRQYMECGRPKKGEVRPENEYIRRTYLINRKKADKLEEIANKETLFLKEILERGIDLVIEEYETKGKIGGSND